MTLVQAWIDSVQLLKPKNFKLFVMVTIKSIIEAYKLLFKYFWLEVSAFIAITVFFAWIAPSLPTLMSQFETVSYESIYWSYGVMSYLLYGFLFLGVCFITRPSIDKKDGGYIRAQYKKIILYFFIIAFLGMSLLSAWSVFLVLFFLDSRGGPKNFLLSMWYALKMIIFNYPLLAVIGIILHLPIWLIHVICVYKYNQMLVLSVVLYNFIGILFLPIGICTYANIYIKKLHDQFDLYIKQPQ